MAKNTVFPKGKLAVVVLTLIGYLPLWLLRVLGKIIGCCSWYANSKARRITEINLQYCLPQLARRSRRALARQSLLNTVIGGLEMAALWSKPKTWTMEKIVETQGFLLLKKCLGEDRGLILLVPHIGNWEVINVQLPHYCDILSLYKPHPLVALNEFILGARTRIGGELVPTDSTSVKLLLTHLKKGKTTCILPDQVPIDSNSAISAPFFGHKAKTMTLIYRLIQKTQCNVLFAYCKRVSGGFVTVFKQPDETIYSRDKLISATALNHGIEQCVLDIPEQYQWEYKRFKEEQSFYRR